MALCTTPSCGCAFTSESLTITQVGSLVTLEQAGDSEITQLRDDLDALQAAYDAYTAANDADITSLSASVAALVAALPSASTTWSPTVTGVTKTSGTETARYVRIGPVVFAFYRFVFGASSAITGDIQISNPVTSNGTNFYQTTAAFADTGTARYDAAVQSINTTTVVIRPVSAGGTYAAISGTASSTVPFTWTTNDVIDAAWAYLAA